MSKTEVRLRQPIVVVLGHVDHGKTTLLDKIRGTAVVKKEPGEMTQEVGASFVPSSVIEKVAQPLKSIIPVKLEIPGLLFIDTPGHELFSNLRRRGGSVADIAILVVDITEGFQKQTTESIEILKDKKVPFLVAANKIDRIPGWKPLENETFTKSFKTQSQSVQKALDNYVYKLVMQLAEMGFNAERFDRVRDFTRYISIVPVSGKTGEGLPELLALLAGLTQQYLKTRLRVVEGPAKGVILEVKEEQGLGHTIDVIIYDGILRKNDTIVLGGINGVIVTKIRNILLPAPLQDMRMTRSGYKSIDEISAAAGVKISAPGLEEALAGSPLYVANDEAKLQEARKLIEEELSKVRFSRNSTGIVVKADSLGSLESLVAGFEKIGIPVRVADIGPITKRDLIEAELSAKEVEEYGIIAAFRVKPLQGLDVSKVKIIYNDIIYQLIDDTVKYIEDLRERRKRRTLDSLILPGKIKILPGYVFRRSDPAIVGIEVLGGVVKPKYPLIREDGQRVGEVLAIQDNKKNLERATKGMEVSMSIKGNIMIGRQVQEGDVLYTDVPQEDLEILFKNYKDSITEDMMEVIKELIKIKKSENPLYGIFIQ
ncbi:putative translation initiation factor IF-2 [Metallosphaera sp. J1]|uniref:translation initiation factor IF-2 n=1 Tax=Metallosphaera javensis (ex Hofmann et al. 2022) TaxID=99938 RepID=UPI001EDF20ED|nr:translation initiation factor IF-2 [Metallosphaera javensis (ex Hofmann et al. 2022)]MCG3107839.1 putative translation initiation factor IF-2 [Metallosphaera javensis (ex Hofmann et al. 2022)]